MVEDSQANLQDSSSANDSIIQLFKLLDQDNDGVLDFPEVTTLFHQLQPKQSVESARNAAVEALLLADRNADTRLNRQEFAQLLTKVAELSGVPLTDAAERLLSVTQQQQQQHPSASATPPSLPDPAPAGDDLAQVHDVAAEAAVPPAAPAAAQLRTLFELWDRQGDGYISFTELCHGLSKMQKPIKHKEDITSLITEAGRVLAAHDSDADRRLDFQEFTSFMTQFMSAAGFHLHEVLEDLIALTQTKPDSEKLQKVLDAAQPQIQRVLSS